MTKLFRLNFPATHFERWMLLKQQPCWGWVSDGVTGPLEKGATKKGFSSFPHLVLRSALVGSATPYLGPTAPARRPESPQSPRGARLISEGTTFHKRVHKTMPPGLRALRGGRGAAESVSSGACRQARPTRVCDWLPTD